MLITTWSAVTGELDKIDKRYGLSDDNREVLNVLWNKIFGKPSNHINPKHDRQRRCKKVSTRVLATEMVKLKILETDWRMNNASFDE